MTRGTPLLGKLTTLLARTPSQAPLSERLLVAFVDLMGADGGAITLGNSKADRTLLASTGGVGERVEELEDVLREGPGLDAFRTGTPVVTSPQEAARHWPLLSQSLGPRLPGLAAYPIKPHSEVLGVVLTCQPHLPDLDADDASFLVNAIGVAIIGRFERSDATELVWTARDRLDHAVGMVVVQLGIPPTDALALLRAHAFSHEATLSEIADAVVDRVLDFRRNPDERG